MPKFKRLRAWCADLLRSFGDQTPPSLGRRAPEPQSLLTQAEMDGVTHDSEAWEDRPAPVDPEP
jgi:hypothetical protein